MDAKLMVATDGGDVKKLKDLQIKEDAMAATSKDTSNEDQPSAPIINPLLLASARVGSWEALNVLLEREDAKKPQMIIPTQEFLELLARGSSAQGRVAATRDVEEGVDHQPAGSLAAGALLKGVTPDGDTALHSVARNHKGGQHFLKCAGIIYDRDRVLLFEKNHEGDTPLHCAARAGNSKMVSHLIDLAAREGADMKLRLLRMENKRQETALHEAVRFEDGSVLDKKKRAALLAAADRAREENNKDDADGAPEEHNIVKLLMADDPELANYPVHGISPLYLAISLGKSTIALTLYHKSGGNLSYSGADGQNALHVAALRVSDTVMVELLVHWKKSLTTQVDKHGSTPLHFAASVWSQRQPELLMIVYKANPAVLYMADKNGLFPIHVAAAVGDRDKIVRFFLDERPDSAGLRDAKGRTFLHVAVEKERIFIVLHACRIPSLAWIRNMQDNEGNTALHLAIQARSFSMFSVMFANREVNLNLINYHGETPCDVSRSKLRPGLVYALTPENKIYNALLKVGANHGALRRDETDEKYSRRPKPKEQEEESNQLKDATQTLIVASVLIATVAFSATFAPPGGYRADDHTNGGTPTLAGGFVFDAFMMANALAFTCSTLATIGFAVAAAPMLNLSTRINNFVLSFFFMSSSVICMTIAFALGVYMMLDPVARNTAIAVIAVCVIIPYGLLNPNRNEIAMSLVRRPGLRRLEGLLPVGLTALWPSIIIFGWAALARIHRHG